MLQKPHVDVQILNQYQPVSNLPFISKVVEHVVAAQFTEYHNAHSLTEPLQSMYRQYHSTVMALTYVLIDISLDQKKAMLLVLLDLSAAFNTIDHQLLLSQLASRLSINDIILDWILTYLTGPNVCPPGIHNQTPKSS